jgi:3-deoxy-D-manno-oct-2-ulosonic acid (Kdo) hydroxylase
LFWNNVTDYQPGWPGVHDRNERSRWYCEQLEQASILFFAHNPIYLPQEHRDILISLRQDNSRIHKNISYRPKLDKLRGYSSHQPGETARLRAIMQQYSESVTNFLSEFLAPYAQHWSLDYASYRPLEEEGRDLPLHKRNDLLHIDAFPSRPTKGGRILRVFTNIHPTKPRVWLTTDRFDVLAKELAFAAGLQKIADHAASADGRWARVTKSILSRIGVPERSAYDRFMLRFHDYLKENSEFQNGCRKIPLEFTPDSTWIVFTDAVPHAVLSGQCALEHTYIVPTDALLAPDKAPIRVLESLSGRSLSA